MEGERVLVFQDKAIVTLKNNISIVGEIVEQGNFYFIKQSVKSNIICIVRKDKLNKIINIKNEQLDFDITEEKIKILMTEEERYVRTRDGISFFGYISYSDAIKKLLGEGILLCINKDMEIYYYIPDDESVSC